MKLQDLPFLTRLLVLPLIAAATLLLASGCTAPSRQPAADEPALIAQAPPDQTSGLAPAPGTGQPEAPPLRAPPMSDPLPPLEVPENGSDGDASQVAVGAPVELDFSCSSNADCTVKDVGNCCGYYPACVNVDSPTDPAAVKAQCASEGTMSVCGFPSISACQCVAGKCEAETAGAVER